ncbi:MAG: hypothetical protein JOZ39_02050 [Chloroflexi bacterium]|nr:hypothetical protein [Chloroflexota bacterium]
MAPQEERSQLAAESREAKAPRLVVVRRVGRLRRAVEPLERPGEVRRRLARQFVARRQVAPRPVEVLPARLGAARQGLLPPAVRPRVRRQRVVRRLVVLWRMPSAARRASAP